MNVWHDVDAGKLPDEVNVIVEIPKGSHNKYEFDKETGLIKLDRVLYSAVFYPGDYGIIPRTLADDGDPADAIVLMHEPTYPGTLIAARPIGALKMIDKGEVDDKILCVPVDDPRFKDVKDLNQIPQATLNEIAHFFEVYKQPEGKKVEIKGWQNAASAKKLIAESAAAYQKKFAGKGRKK